MFETPFINNIRTFIIRLTLLMVKCVKVTKGFRSFVVICRTNTTTCWKWFGIAYLSIYQSTGNLLFIYSITFYFFSFVAVLSALMVISSKNPVHSVLFLILSFVSASGLFVLLGAEFLAMILIVVYVGAVAVLFLFVVMMLNVAQQQNEWFTSAKDSAYTYGLAY